MTLYNYSEKQQGSQWPALRWGVSYTLLTRPKKAETIVGGCCTSRAGMTSWPPFLGESSRPMCCCSFSGPSQTPLLFLTIHVTNTVFGDVFTQDDTSQLFLLFQTCYIHSKCIQYSAHGYAAPARGYAAPARGYAAPARGYAAPARGYAAPARGYAAPARGYAAPARGYAAPARGYAAPARGYAAPARGYAAPARGYAAPARGYAAPARGYAAPARGYAAPN
uniref:Uncharacterized protein n=1 Tax=Leptobrachium leishanense TaxID=445787 RepID=A0A8C5WED9_9ANUR